VIPGRPALVRRICKHAENRAVKEEIAAFLVMHGINAEKVRVRKGCDKCARPVFRPAAACMNALLRDHRATRAREIPTSRNPQDVHRAAACDAAQRHSRSRPGVTTVEEVLNVTEGTI